MIALFITAPVVPLYLVVGQIYFNRTGVSIPGVRQAPRYIEYGATLLIAGITVSAMLEYSAAQTRVRRVVLASVLLNAGLIFAAQLLWWMQPHLGSLLRPLITTFGYCFATLVILVLVLDPRSKRRGKPSKAS